MNMKFINPLSIEEIKKIEIQILETFTDFCKKNNLKYYLAYGTLIGAIRHKGFIPWDDDIDLEMPREDYNRMIELLSHKKNLITNNIELKTPYSKNYQYQFCKVIDNTTFVQEKTMKKKYKTSIWIDIFPIDYLPENPDEEKKFLKKMFNMQKYYFYTIERKYSGADILGRIKFNMAKILFTPLYFIINQKQRINKLSQKYLHKKSNRITNIAGCIKLTSIMNVSDLAQTSVIFENNSYTTFSNYDKILRDYYGDYMMLPPENERILAHSLSAYRI